MKETKEGAAPPRSHSSGTRTEGRAENGRLACRFGCRHYGSDPRPTTHHRSYPLALAVIRLRRQPTGPRNITMAGRIERVIPFTEDPPGAMKRFAQREIIRRYVLFASGKSLFRRRELIHQRRPAAVAVAGR